MSATPVAAVYSYQDENGFLLFQCVRYDPKSFSYRRPNPDFDDSKPAGPNNPEWVNNLEGIERVVYALPKIKELLALKPERWVFIVEGEKDADLLLKAGLAATTNPHGAGKWLERYNPVFAGCNVCIIPDEDPVDNRLGYSPGLQHAATVAKNLKGIAKSIRLIRLPGTKPKRDISDWWAEQKGTDQDRLKVLGELVKKSEQIWPEPTKPAEAPKAVEPPKEEKAPEPTADKAPPANQAAAPVAAPATAPTTAAPATAPSTVIDFGEIAKELKSMIDGMRQAGCKMTTVAEFIGAASVNHQTLLNCCSLTNGALHLDFAAVREHTLVHVSLLMMAMNDIPELLKAGKKTK